MLIYNSKKEFLGIDEVDLEILGFSDLSTLKSQVDDFADMFVKTPGFIHNFKHVNWIDFVACADANSDSKVIINTNDKNFKCNLEIKTAFLNDDPSSKAFLVYLNNIREVSVDGSDKVESIVEAEKTNTDINLDIDENNYNNDIEATQQENEIPDTSEENILTLDLDEEPIKLEKKNKEELVVEKKILKKVAESITQMEIFDNGYFYDPKIASGELGLPLELIEEFIEDFIAQSKEFKSELYTSLDNGDSDNVKSLSHKLKGVAANLRIEDAFETLATINTSDNHKEISTNLDIFYKIISKLSDEKITVTKNKLVQNDEVELVTQPTEEVLEKPSEIDIFSINEHSEVSKPKKELVLEEDDIVLSFKDEPINDNDVPNKIEMPELADDEFLTPKSEDKIDIDDSIDIENISDKERISLQNKSIEIDDIELLDSYEIEEDQAFDIELIEEPELVEYNKKQIADEIGIPLESFLTLFDDYISEAKELSNDISTAVKKHDYKQWRDKALQLKSMNENMRIDTFTDELIKLIKTKDSDIAKKTNKKISVTISELSKMDG